MKFNSRIPDSNLENSTMGVKDKFLRLCDDICLMYESLQEEFAKIMNVLNMAECYASSYSDMIFVKGHIRSQKISLKLCTISEILIRVEDIKGGSKAELLQEIDFINIVDEIINKDTPSDIILFVWKAKKVLKHIIYEIDRINNSGNSDKQVAILKGMIAYY